MTAALTNSIGPGDLTRLHGIVLHLRCFCRDHKYSWHLAGIWRELFDFVF